MLSHMSAAVAGAIGGITYSLAAVETLPPSDLVSMTPSVDTGLAGVMVAIVALLVKHYVPSVKGVSNEFTIMKEGQKTLGEKLVELATTVSKAEATTSEFRQDLRRWMGKIDARLDGVDTRFDATDHRIDRMDLRNRI